MERASLIAKLVDGTTTRPIGVVKDIWIKTSRITYHAWFVVMDFKNQVCPCDIILGRPFVRLLGIVPEEVKLD